MKRTRIGLVFAHHFAFQRDVLRGIRRYVEAKPQWQITSFVPEPQPLRVLGRLRPAGLIASVTTKLLVRTLACWRRPVVNVSHVFPGLRFPRVGVDNVQVGRLAAEHFLKRGLRHLGFIAFADYLAATERGTAFCQAVREAGHEVACFERSPQVPYNPLDERRDLDASVHRWLRALPKPVGVFVPNDQWGMQIAEACLQVGLRVPEDVALLGNGNDDLHCELTRPPLSSVIVPAERIGYEAAALLDRLLAGAKPPRKPLLLPPTGVAVRRSTEVLAIEDEQVVAAVRFIREHAHLPLRVANVLGQVGAGRRTLERRCRVALGHGLGEEIRRTHLERACRLLAETDLPMKTLAEQAGFSDGSYMGVVFRQELGVTPTVYRRQMRGPASSVRD